MKFSRKVLICSEKTMMIIGPPTAVLHRLIAAFAPTHTLCIPRLESWELLAEQARIHQVRCVIINLDHNPSDIRALDPLWEHPPNLPYLIGITCKESVGFHAFKLGFNDIYGLGDLAIHVAKRFHHFNRFYNSYLCFESGKKKLYLKPKEILFLKADNYNTDLFLTTGQSIPLFNTLKSYAQHLPPSFVRIQKSLVINTQFVYAVESTKRKCWLMGHPDIFTYSPIYIKTPALLVRYPENRFHCV